MYGMQLPIQSQSTIYAEPWEADATADDLAAHRPGRRPRRVLLRRGVRPHRHPRGPGRVDGHRVVGHGRHARLAGRHHRAGAPAEPRRRARLPAPAADGQGVVDPRQRVGRPGHPRASASGHVEGEFDLLGLDFAGRGPAARRGDRRGAGRVRRRVPGGQGSAVGVRGLRASGPGRCRPGGPPIWVGGSSKPALRRAAERGDGWLPQGPVTPEVVEFIRSHRAATRGRRPDRHRRHRRAGLRGRAGLGHGAVPHRAAGEARPRAAQVRGHRRRPGPGAAAVALGRRAARPDRAVRRRGRARPRRAERSTEGEQPCCWRARSRSCRASARAWGATSRWRWPSRAPTSCSAAAREAKLEGVAKEVEALGRRALPVRCDVADPDACIELADRAAAELGGIDVLVNNAFHGGDAKSVLDADLAGWRDVIDINLFGALHMTRAVVPHMEARGGGRIVMINTMSTERIQANFGSYAASKSALKGVSRTPRPRARPEGHPGQRDPPRLHLGRLGRVVLQLPGREAGGHLPGGLRRGRGGDLPRLPALVRGDRRRGRVLRLRPRQGGDRAEHRRERRPLVPGLSMSFIELHPWRRTGRTSASRSSSPASASTAVRRAQLPGWRPSRASRSSPVTTGSRCGSSGRRTSTPGSTRSTSTCRRRACG